MHALNCPHHGDEALEYLRGRLDTDAVLHAEEHLETCAHCSAWYQSTFSGDDFDAVDQAVRHTFHEVALPRRTHRRQWLAAAAAVTLIVAGGYGWRHHSGEVAPTVVDQPSTIASLDFEEGLVALDESVVFVDEQPEIVAEHAADTDDGKLSTIALEGGDFGSWEIHT